MKIMSFSQLIEKQEVNRTIKFKCKNKLTNQQTIFLKKFLNYFFSELPKIKSCKAINQYNFKCQKDRDLLHRDPNI